MARKTLSPIDKEIIELELEKSRIDREKSMLVLNKGLFLYFSFLFVAVMGFINGFLSKDLLNILIRGTDLKHFSHIVFQSRFFSQDIRIEGISVYIVTQPEKQIGFRL